MYRGLMVTEVKIYDTQCIEKNFFFPRGIFSGPREIFFSAGNIFWAAGNIFSAYFLGRGE